MEQKRKFYDAMGNSLGWDDVNLREYVKIILHDDNKDNIIIGLKLTDDTICVLYDGSDPNDETLLGIDYINNICNDDNIYDIYVPNGIQIYFTN